MSRIVSPLILTALVEYSYYYPFFLSSALGFTQALIVVLVLLSNRRIHKHRDEFDGSDVAKDMKLPVISRRLQ
jgi:hypothetical protein